MSQPEQNLANHAKMVPLYHYGITALLLATLAWSIASTVREFSVERLMILFLVIALLLTTFYARVFPLGVQDRVIRLEERLRLERLLPEDLQRRIPEFTTDQLIGLRFATDRELVDLASRVLDGELADRAAIKKAIKVWRADHQRI